LAVIGNRRLHPCQSRQSHQKQNQKREERDGDE
jgi:hypothetical protein